MGSTNGQGLANMHLMVKSMNALVRGRMGNDQNDEDHAEEEEKDEDQKG